MWRQRAGSGNTTSIRCRHQINTQNKSLYTEPIEGGWVQGGGTTAVLKRHQQKIRSQRKREKRQTVNHWPELFCVTYSLLSSAHSLLHLRRRRITTSALCVLRASNRKSTSSPLSNVENLNRGTLQPPSACAMSLSPAALCCGLCWVL